METNRLNRREALAAFGALAAGIARAAELPLRTTGLEHLGMTVPDPRASAEFYGRIFDPQLFQEKDPPPRFYVKLGSAYAAFGGTASVTPKIDHICALVEEYKPQEMRKSLEEAGVPLGPGARGMAIDPDGMQLQLLGVPGGLARTIIPGGRISQDDAAVQAIGLDHIMLRVSDLERSTAFYRKFFGPEVSRTKNPARIWFSAAQTKLGLEAAAGHAPGVDHFSLRIPVPNRRIVADRLKHLGVEAAPPVDDGLLSFRDPNGFTVELVANLRPIASRPG
jgi:catechol 2,3-dioxygenase-like lactoylglutathione lyase family enzyme